MTHSSPTNATIADGRGVGTIDNDDPMPKLRIIRTRAVVPEGDTGMDTAVFTVVLDGATEVAAQVSLATAGGTATAGSDYQATGC